MSKVGLCESLPVHATIIIEPNGAICITTPTSTQEFGCVKANISFVGCIVESRFSSKPLILKSEEIKVVQPIEDKESKKITYTFLTNEQNEQLQNLLISYVDIFS